VDWLNVKSLMAEICLKLGLNKTSNVLRRSFHFGVHALIEPRLIDEDNRRREFVLNVLLVGSIVMLAILDVLVWRYTPPSGNVKGISFVVFSIFLAFFVCLYSLSRRGFVKTASYLFVAAYFLANSYAAYYWGITLPSMLVGYALLVVVAGLVVDSRFGFITAGISAAYVAVMWWSQLNGLYQAHIEELTMGDGISLGVLYLFITGVAWLSNRQIEGSLARARRSEKALAEQRDRLEIEVEERTRELREMQFAKVEQLYRFAEFGQMASGLFHDLVNFFNAVLLHMQQQDPDSEAGVTEARARLETAGVLTGRVNEFVAAIRKQLAEDSSEETFSVKREIGQVAQLLAFTARKRKVELAILGEDAACFGNCFKFHQVFMNLILNAVESYDGIPEDDRRERTVIVSAARSAGFLALSVADHGVGIPEAAKEKIFTPFFSTKCDGKGMGIGLAITKRIVENDFHGALDLQSEVGIGSTFTIRIPLNK
jgi:signal transduction histidine kinase